MAESDPSATPLDYKHKKFDVSKRIRCDSTSSTTSSLLDVCTLESSSGSSTPFGSTSECSAAPAHFRKRSHTSPEAVQPPFKRRLLLSDNNDSGISLASGRRDLSASSDLRHSSTPLPTEVAAVAAFKRRLCVAEPNDSGFSVDAASRLTPLHPRFTSTPLTVLADVATVRPPLKRRRVSEDSDISAIPIDHHVPDAAFQSAPFCARPRCTYTPLAVLAAVAATAPLQERTSSQLLPQISNETMQSICRYHENMVRRFPKKERTPKDQERRNKNTIACRVSRRLKKLENVAIEEQYKEFARQHSEIVEASVRAAAYLNTLTVRLAAVGSQRWAPGSEKEAAGAAEGPDNNQCRSVVRQPKPFTIEYLSGQDGSS